MSDYAQAINQHYGQAELSAKILTALREAGKDLAALTRDDLAPFDEHHRGGREATRELAHLVGLRAGMHVLDVGSGFGGAGTHPRRRVWLPGHWPRSHRGMLSYRGDADGPRRAARPSHVPAGQCPRHALREGHLRCGVDPGCVDEHGGQAAPVCRDTSGPPAWRPLGVPSQPGWSGAWRLLSDVLGRRRAARFLLPPEECRRLVVASGFQERAWYDTTAPAPGSAETPRDTGSPRAAWRSSSPPTSTCVWPICAAITPKGV